MFEHFGHAHEMYALVRRAKEQGIATGLLSNSWGNDYPRDMWQDMFDVVVISGEVGLRKPEPEIFERALARAGVGAREAAYVGDSPEFDVAPSSSLGMRAFLIDRRDRHDAGPGTKLARLTDLPGALGPRR